MELSELRLLGIEGLQARKTVYFCAVDAFSGGIILAWNGFILVEGQSSIESSGF